LLIRKAAQNEAEAEHRAPSLIEAGFYYEKGNNPGWLRRVVDFRGHEGRVCYVDFTGVGQCDISSLSRWVQRRLTREEAMAEFPDEIGKLEDAFCDALVTWQEQAERMITELTKTFPGVTREQVGEYYLKKRSSD
jgi:hypothetical protein